MLAGAWLGLALLLAGLITCYLVAAKRTAGGLGLPLDDGWIHARFAQNLAHGYGFSFNPGEPTSTTTSPLWTLLLALGYRITGEHLFTSIAINYALSLALLALVYRLCLAFAPSRWLALSAALVTAVTAPLQWWALSGMEPLLYASLALLGILLHVRARGETLAREIPATVAFALAALARPEMLLLFPLAMVDRLLSMRERSAMLWLKELAVSAPIYALLIAPFFFHNLRVTGYLLPTSYYSKLQWRYGGVSPLLAGAPVSAVSALIIYPLRELAEVVLVWLTDNCILGLTFLIGAGWMVWRWRKEAAEEPRSLLIPMMLIVQPLAWAMVGGYRPPGYQSQRYLADLNPLFVLLGVVGGWLITERLPALRRAVPRAVLLAAVLAASLNRQAAGAQTYAMNVKNTNEMQVAIGRWLKANAPPDSLLAVNDIGAIGCITNMRVLDLQGLVTPEVLSLRDMRSQMNGTAPVKMFEFIVSHKPGYLVIFPQWYPELDQRRDLFAPVYWVQLTDNITNGADVMVVYRTIWAGGAAGVKR
jgi:hypothetical protein